MPMLSDSLRTGSTRERLFKALLHYSRGLTIPQVKRHTGIFKVSGHIHTVIEQEIERGNVRCEQHDIDSKDTRFYFLTKSGVRLAKGGDFDQRKAGKRIGQRWTKPRRNFENGIT